MCGNSRRPLGHSDIVSPSKFESLLSPSFPPLTPTTRSETRKKLERRSASITCTIPISSALLRLLENKRECTSTRVFRACEYSGDGKNQQPIEISRKKKYQLLDARIVNPVKTTGFGMFLPVVSKNMYLLLK